ncbi:hypothetical protein ACFFX0_14480 [Citricoccus parietis]|uniref:Uncharacterized protein n=1 Tax=Citricoccus parietis TaxID=592307 RepID=A0ABV5G062_9MICC
MFAMRPTDGSECTHWLLPVNPAAHAEHLPADWRTRHDATGVWEAIGRTQAIDRWCLSSGFRTMRPGGLAPIPFDQITIASSDWRSAGGSCAGLDHGDFQRS